MKKVVDWFGGSVVKDLLSGLDGLFTSKEEKIKAQNVVKQDKGSECSKANTNREAVGVAEDAD